MRFRAEVVNVTLLGRLCAAASKVTKQCVLVLSTEQVQLIAQTPSTDGTSVWVELPSRVLFDSQEISSAAQHNAIALRLNAEHLERAAKSGINAQAFRVHLRKRHAQPVLSFTAEIPHPQPLTVTHDVPCQPLGSRALLALGQPMLRPPDFSVKLPSIKSLKHIVEHLTNIADTLTVSVVSDGQFVLEANTPSAKVVVTYTGLESPLLPDAGEASAISSSTSTAVSSAPASADSSQVPAAARPKGTPPVFHEPSRDAAATTTTTGAAAAPTAAAAAGATSQPDKAEPRAIKVCVAASKFAKFLPCAQLQPESAMCCLVEQYNIVMYVLVGGDVSLTYYIPVLCT